MQNEEYQFTIFSVIQIIFGVIDGMVNALPIGDNLYLCGANSEEQRNAMIEMYEYFVERKLTKSVYQAYVSLRYMHAVANHCFYGLTPLVNLETIQTLLDDLDIVYNLLFNFGFIWTDLVMLSIGRIGETEVDYFYYLFFYLADLVMRFLFRQTSDGYCWLPWNNCETFVSQELTIEITEELD